MVLGVVPVCISNLSATIYLPPHTPNSTVCIHLYVLVSVGAVILVHVRWVLWFKDSHKATVTMGAEIADSSEASVGKKVQFQAPSCGYWMDSVPRVLLEGSPRFLTGCWPKPTHSSLPHVPLPRAAHAWQFVSSE